MNENNARYLFEGISADVVRRQTQYSTILKPSPNWKISRLGYT